MEAVKMFPLAGSHIGWHTWPLAASQQHCFSHQFMSQSVCRGQMMTQDQCRRRQCEMVIVFDSLHLHRLVLCSGRPPVAKGVAPHNLASQSLFRSARRTQGSCHIGFLLLLTPAQTRGAPAGKRRLPQSSAQLALASKLANSSSSTKTIVVRTEGKLWCQIN